MSLSVQQAAMSELFVFHELRLNTFYIQVKIIQHHLSMKEK